MRKYMSKAQRACDSCRARKSACRIDSAPPCRLCHLSGRDCTFEAAPKNTRALAATATHVSLNNSTQEPAGLEVTNQQSNVLNSDGVFFDQQGYLMLGESPDPSANLWVDQAMIDMNIQNFNHIDPPPNDVSMEYPGLPSPSAQGLEMTSIVCGLTGDMDPYLMQRYNFGPDNNFVFKRLAVRSVTQDIHPVQLLVSNVPDMAEECDPHNHSFRKQLETLVTPDVGVRLISLYERPRPIILLFLFS